jgi:hypothetical protein
MEGLNWFSIYSKEHVRRSLEEAARPPAEGGPRGLANLSPRHILSLIWEGHGL